MHRTDNDMSRRLAERRAHFRVEDEVLVCYRHHAVPDEGDGRSGVPDAFELASVFGELRQKTTLLHRQARQEGPRIAEYLHTVDQKLDRLMEVMLARELQADNPTRQTVEIGADGISFATREPVDAGAVIELRLLLLSTGTGLRLHGRVVRCEPEQTSGEGFRLGVEFMFEREADRELLLHHLLHRQSELIREQHQAEDDTRR